MESECPICGAKIKLEKGVEESEIITCFECRGRIFVEKIEGEKVILKEAPNIEEDWGE